MPDTQNTDTSKGTGAAEPIGPDDQTLPDGSVLSYVKDAKTTDASGNEETAAHQIRVTDARGSVRVFNADSKSDAESLHRLVHAVAHLLGR